MPADVSDTWVKVDGEVCLPLIWAIVETSLQGLWAFLWDTSSRKHLLHFPDFFPFRESPPTPFLQWTNGQADFPHVPIFLKRGSLEPSISKWCPSWLPYPLLCSFLFFSLLFQLIIMTASSTQLFCSTLIIFFPQDIWGIRSRPEKSDRQEFILFIVILNLGFCHFPPPKEREANGIPFWKGIKNRHKYATLQDSSPQISSYLGRCAVSTFLEVDPLLKNGSQETIYISAQRKSVF